MGHKGGTSNARQDDIAESAINVDNGKDREGEKDFDDDVQNDVIASREIILRTRAGAKVRGGCNAVKVKADTLRKRSKRLSVNEILTSIEGASNL